MVAWNMSELSHFIRLFRAPIGDVAILLTGFILTVFVDITAAISLGMILASFLFMKRMSDCSKTVSLTAIFKEASSDFPEESDPDSILFRGLAGESFYFVHSFAAKQPVIGALTSWTNYGERFVAAVERGSVSAVQFHPEKSGAAGARLISNWASTL